MVAIAISLTTLLCLSVVVVFLIALFMIYLRWDPLKGPSHLDLAGKHVVITGGSSGIGKALAILCVKQKALVTIIARNQNKLDEAVEEITGKVPNCKVQAKSADVTNFDNLSQAINEASRHFSRPVDVLVCSAGATNPLRFEDLSVSDFENVMNVNFLGIVNSVKVVLPGMKQRKFGRIVFISSQVGQLGMFGYTAYSASKFAVRGFAESLYPEVKPHGIFISISYPPDTDTPMYEEEMKLKPIETKLMSESGSVFKPDDVAKDILQGIERWKFCISHGFDGKVIATLSGCAAPPSSFLEVILETLTLPFLRLIWVFYVLSSWFKIALSHAKVQ